VQQSQEDFGVLSPQLATAMRQCHPKKKVHSACLRQFVVLQMRSQRSLAVFKVNLLELARNQESAFNEDDNEGGNLSFILLVVFDGLFFPPY
jgi:hypothetical protein